MESSKEKFKKLSTSLIIWKLDNFIVFERTHVLKIPRKLLAKLDEY